MTDSLREAREARAYDEDGVFERSHAWADRFNPVLTSPNTLRGEEWWQGHVAAAVRDGGRALDIGCGDGSGALMVRALGASYVRGIDLSADMVARARELEDPGTLEFTVASAQEPVEGRFDLVYGRAVLHHVDLREVTSRLYRDNLAPGGRMLWMEPFYHPLARAFHLLVRSAHTPDERLLNRADLAWMRATFPRVEVHPVNWVTFPVAAVSALVSRRGDTAPIRWADRVDRKLERFPRLLPYARYLVFAITKPSGAGG